MKKLLLLVSVCLSLTSYAQNLVGVSRAEIKRIANEEGWRYKEASGVGGVPFMEVAEDADNLKFYFFNNLGVCHEYIVFYGNRSLEQIQESLNQNYSRKEDTIWYTDQLVIAVDWDSILLGYFVKFKKI